MSPVQRAQEQRRVELFATERRVKIYLAGPLFTSAEQEWNRQLAGMLRAYDHEIWLPQAFKPEPNTSENIFKKDLEGLDWCHAVVANMDGPDPDSGTAWECSWGRSYKRPVFAYRTDFRNITDTFAPFNLMLYHSVTKYVECILASPAEVARRLNMAFSDYAFGR